MESKLGDTLTNLCKIVHYESFKMWTQNYQNIADISNNAKAIHVEF